MTIVSNNLKDEFWVNVLGKSFGIDITELEENLRYKSRFILPERLKNLVNDFVEFQLKNNKFLIQPGDIYYRARINGIGSKNKYSSREVHAPPKGKASAGRINPEGISYLYLASSRETAVAEVRPWKGAKISVGKFAVINEISVVKLDVPKQNEIKSCDGLSKYPISVKYFSTPVHRDDKHAYLASQYIIENLRFGTDGKNGVDGVQYESVQNPCGHNIAIFDNFDDFVTCSDEDVILASVKNINYDVEFFDGNSVG